MGNKQHSNLRRERKSIDRMPPSRNKDYRERQYQKKHSRPPSNWY